MNAISSDIQESAVWWAVRTSDAEFTDWPAFVAWLERDPAHGDAYDVAVAAVAKAADAIVALPDAGAVVVPFPAPGSSVARPSRRWVTAGGLAIAASIAALVYVAVPADQPAMKVIETAPGRSRTIALADGSRVDLAGGSRIRLDPSEPRRAALDRGRAIFTVRHDAAAPFRVAAGGHDIVDAGTAFEVVRDDGTVAVAVAEGLVVVDPARGALELKPGDSAVLRGGSRPAVSRVAPDAIGQWRHALMSYRDAPLARVAADLSASLGRPIAIDDDLGGRRFTGVLVPASIARRPGDLAAALGVAVRRDGEGLVLSAR